MLKILDFVVSPDGEVAAIAAAPHELYFLRFGKDGTASSRTKLELVFKPKQVVLFENGSFLVSGATLVNNEGDRPEALNVVFSADGRILKKIQTRPVRTQDDESRSRPTDEDVGINPEIEYGAAVRGTDGNAYLLRHASPATVYVISPTGELVRTLTIRPPFKEMLPYGMIFSDEKLLITFVEDQQVSLIAADAQTGEPLAEYIVPDELGAALACSAEGGEFTFLNHAKGKLVLARASVK
jgi:hypothetical protein